MFKCVLYNYNIDIFFCLVWNVAATIWRDGARQTDGRAHAEWETQHNKQAGESYPISLPYPILLNEQLFCISFIYFYFYLYIYVNIPIFLVT